MESRLQIFQTFMIFWNYTPKTGNIGTKKHGQIAVLLVYQVIQPSVYISVI